MTIKDWVDVATIVAGIATLFGTIAAFWGIRLLYLAYKSQKEELGDTKEALRLQKEEMKVQRIESTYLNLLDSHNRFVETISTKTQNNDVVRGKKAFYYINSKVNELQRNLNDSEYVTIADAYSSEIYRIDNFVRSYIRSIDVPMTYLQRSDLTDTDYRFYSDIHLSQLSETELEFIQDFCFAFEQTNDLIETRQRLKYLTQLRNR